MTSALVVYESFFGNTSALAQDVARGLHAAGLDVTVTAVRNAPPDVREVDLLVVGAPTHFLGLSTALSRWLHAQYWGDSHGVRRIHRPHGRPVFDASLRAWLGHLPSARPGARAAVFDTRTSRCAVGAGAGAARALRACGFTLVCPPETFVVKAVSGPLADGEKARAMAWATALTVAHGPG